MAAAWQGAAAETAPIDWSKARQHWAFQAPRKPAAPAVRDSSWVKQPLDLFILAKMESLGLMPAREADRRTLARRLFFDLNGLPPAPAELDRFLKDRHPDAVERLVDDLLERRAFGEHLASLWLPLARYAEDQAHIVGTDTSLSYPNAYKYRDWVVAAFNRDLPYDRFVQQQLAVDLLEPENKTDLAALGFLGLGHKLYARSRTDVMAEEWAEKVDTVSQAFLGLTVGCARCHDHKYDPITMRDYYSLAGVFASLKMVNKSADGKKEEDKTKADKMSADTLHLVEDGTPEDLNIFERGDVEAKGPVAPRGYLQVLSKGEPVQFHEGSGRGELAKLIASPSNPLTARIMVNRLWDMMFGRPIVRTTSNFGLLGEKPSHPELLDHLALRFIEEGWSVKRLVRELALSATYRQDATGREGNERLDPANTCWWHAERRRLGVEQFRDAVLAVSGALENGDGKSLELDDAANHHRTLYARISRRELNKTLMLFDYPDANVHAARRSSTTTPTQKLFVINSPFMLAQAKALAARVNSEAPDDAGRIRRAFELLFARPPEPGELEMAQGFLREAPAAQGMTAWERLAHALLSTNEMMYVD